MPFSATELLAELPRLRRYARILIDDTELADRLVEETLLRCRKIEGTSAPKSTRTMQLLRLLRAVNAEQTAPSRRREPPRGALSAGRSNSKADRGRSEGPSPPDQAVEMLAQLLELPLEQREVLVLVAVERMSYMDVAAVLDAPVATVISRLSQARKALRSTPPKPLSAPNNAS